MTISINAGLPVDTVAQGVGTVERGQPSYETVAASQTDQVMGGTGAIGDVFHRIIITVATAATAAAVAESVATVAT